MDTFEPSTLTVFDLLALRTGYLPYTLGMIAAYGYVLALLLPGATRMWGGIARALASAFYDEARRALWHVQRLGAVVRAVVRPIRAPQPLPGWAYGAAVEHPKRVACAFPALCDECRRYSAEDLILKLYDEGHREP